MKKTIFIILGITAAFCFGFFIKTIIAKQPDNNVNVKQTENIKMKKVIGVGGIFFKCKDPTKVKDWYKTHLGFDTNEYGANFEWQEGADTTKKVSLVWSPFSETTKYFEPSTKEFMVNYRVENLVELVEQLKSEGVTFIDSIETYPYGKFVHIMDIEGNKIELYEPNYDHDKHDK
jgi:predicted enzyme related to lactoylglutathione lyase